MSITFANGCLRCLLIFCLLREQVVEATPKATKSPPTSLQTTTRGSIMATTPENGAVRLVNSYYRGRVEIYINNGWRKICFDSFNFKMADIICRQLGHSYGMNIGTFVVYSQEAIYRVHSCPETATLIQECDIKETTYCNYCIKLACNDIRQPIKDFDMRLIAEDYNSMGYVQVYYQGQWGYICNHNWDMREADIVCKALGFERALSDSPHNLWPKSYPFIISNIVCTGSEILLKACAMSFGNYCSSKIPAFVVCSNEQLTVPTYDVRLAGGSTPLEGGVEILIDREWGYVCDDHWTLVEAFVVCRQLGFEYAISALKNSAFGAGAGEIKLDDVSCSGVEEDLILCRHPGARIHNCNDRSEQAGVICSNVTAPPIGSRIELKSCKPNQGHVHVYHNRILWRVCNTGWDDNDARVVCRQKNYRYGLAIPAPIDGRALQQSNSVAAYIDQVDCNGTEISLAACRFGVVKPFKCAYYNDAAVFCTNKFSEYLSEKEKVVKDSMPLRLTGSITDNTVGRVEVFVNGSWWIVCSNQTRTIYQRPSEITTIASQTASVICRQLHFESAIEKQIELLHEDARQSNTYAFIGNPVCHGNEMTLFDCVYQQLQPPYQCPIGQNPLMVACATYQACSQDIHVPTEFEPKDNRFLLATVILLFICLCGLVCCVCILCWKCKWYLPLFEFWPLSRFRGQHYAQNRIPDRWLNRTLSTPEPDTTIYDPPHLEPPPPSYHHVIENPENFPLYKRSGDGDVENDDDEDEEEPPPAYNYHGYDVHVNGDVNDAEGVQTTMC